MSQSGVSDITVALSYKSNKSIDGVFGKGFYWNYESFLKEENSKILLYHSPCEFVEYEKKDGASVYVTKAKGSKLDELNKNTDGSFTLKSNEKVFDYNKEGKLVKVTQKTKESVSIEYKNKETVLHDDLSGQTISLLFNDKGQVVKVTNNATAEATFEYNDKGYLTKYTDADGFVTEYTFDEEGRVLTGKDADGNVFFTDFYDEKGRVKEQKDALGNLSTFEYKEIESAAQDKTNVIVKETILKDREGNAEVSSFDEAGRLLKTVDEEGNNTLKEYDKEGNLIKSTDALGNVTLSEYDEKDNLIKSVDALGNETKYEYDENRNVTKITFPDGSVNTFTYDAKNRLLSLTDQRGLVTEKDYYENGLLKSSKKGNQITNYTYENGEIKTIEDSLGNVTTLDYDENGHLVNTEDALGAKTKLSVSPFGAVTATTDAYGSTKSFTLSPFDKPLKVTDEEGNVATNEYDERQLLKASIDNKGNRTEFFYDKEERLVKTVFPDGTFTENEYDKTGKLLSTTDALGNKTSFTYDAKGNVVKETDKEGNETSFTYNAKGQVLTKTDSKGNVTSFSYDLMGRKVTEKNALGGVTKYSYNTAGDLVSIEDALGNVTTFTYDEYGRKVSETDSNGNTTTFKYDLNGNLVETINALGESTFYKYDSLNRLIKTSVVDEAHSVEIAYDLNGRVVSETDPNGNTTRRVYDKRGNISKVIDALGYETSYVYDKNGNLVSSTNAKGQTIRYEINNRNLVTKETNALNLESAFSYDNNGRLKSVVNPMGGVSENIFDKKGNILELVGPNGAKTDFTYDSNNNLTSRSTVAGNSVKYTYNALNLAETMTNGRGQNFTYEYDLLGRITKSISPEGETTYSYDKNSNVLTITDLNGTITRTYDSLNRVSSVTDTYGNTVSYVYDSYGNLARLIYPDNTAVSYTYDSLGNIKTVTDWEGRVTTYNYDSLNREIECFNANGTKTEKGYDEIGNVVRIAEYKEHAATTLTAETILEYDQGNRLVKETETVKGIAYEYSYDDLSRVLSRKTIDTKTGTVTDEETFGYDPAGNIVNSTGREAKKALSYIAEDNRLDLADGVKFTFDNDGNLVSGKLFDKDTTLTYDSKNRLTGFNDDSYVYDAEDYRIQSEVNVLEEVKKDNNQNPQGTENENTGNDEEPGITEPEVLHPTNLLKLYYDRFEYTGKGNPVDAIRAHEDMGVGASLERFQGEDGNLYTSEIHLDIDVSEYKYIDMIAVGAVVYLDDELVYNGLCDVENEIYNGIPSGVEKHFDVRGKSKLTIKSFCTPAINAPISTPETGNHNYFYLDYLTADTRPEHEDDSQGTIDLLDKYYKQFYIKRGWGLSLGMIDAQTPGTVMASLYGRKDSKGNWLTDEIFSGEIDVSMFDYIDMTAANACVYLDGELVYDGIEGLSDEETELHFDVSGKSRLEIKSFCKQNEIYDKLAQYLLGGLVNSFKISKLIGGIKSPEAEQNNDKDSNQQGNQNENDENPSIDTTEPKDSEPDDLQPTNLMRLYYDSFVLDEIDGVKSYLWAHEFGGVDGYTDRAKGADGKWYTSECHVDIDVSEYKFVDMVVAGVVVYLDDEIVYNGLDVKSYNKTQKHFDVRGKSKLTIRSFCTPAVNAPIDKPRTSSSTYFCVEYLTADIDLTGSVDLLAKYYRQFSLSETAGSEKGYILKESNGVYASYYGKTDENGNWRVDELTSGTIDVSDYDYVEMTVEGAAVYLDGKLAYSCSEEEYNPVDIHLDVSDKSEMEIRGISKKPRYMPSFWKDGYLYTFRLHNLRGWLTKSEGEIVCTSAIEILDSDEPENEESAYSQTEPSDDTIITDDGVGDDVTLGASDGIAAEPISGLGADGENEGAPESSGNESVSDNNSAIEAESADVSSNELGETDVSSNEFDVSGNNLDVSGNEFDVSGNELDVSGNEISIEEQTEFVYKMVVSRYCYNRNNKDLLVTTTDDGKIIKYVYGNGLISSYTEETDSEGNKDLSFESYSYDLRGSVTRVTDEAGNIKTEYAYSTYGKRSVISGDQNHFSVLGYCARDGVLTEENGLLYMRVRYYSTELMRFINQDIVVGDISNSSSLNRYTFVEGNPATLIDPFGLDPSRAENAALGSYNLFKGSAMMGIGASAMKLGVIVAAAGGPVGWILGGGLFIVGGISIIFGYSDVCEGGQQIANAVCDTNYHTTNLVRDYCFAGDQVAYESVEFMLPSLAYGMGTIGSAYVSSRQAPTTSISQAAGYDNSGAVNETNVGKAGGNSRNSMDFLNEIEFRDGKCYAEKEIIDEIGQIEAKGEDFSLLNKSVMNSRASSEGGTSCVYRYGDDLGTKYMIHEVTDSKGNIIHRDFDAVRISSGQMINKKH